MDRRAHHRVQLRLPARLRWTTPLGQKTEVCHTVNVSRGGVQVPCQEAHAEGGSLWVTFPYDPAIPYAQPEILANIVRFVASTRPGTNGAGANRNGSASGPANGDAHSGVVGAYDDATGSASVGRTPAAAAVAQSTHAIVGLRFEVTRRHHLSANGNGHRREGERRASPRQQLAVPVRVRPEHVPWFEETMTIDCSAEGLKFRSNREYSPGQYLAISFERADTSPWPVAAAEMVLMVSRIEKVPQNPTLNVAVFRSVQCSFRF